jgi:hypothetical protein
MDWTAPQQALSELWELFAERRGDNGRDLALLLARRSYTLTEPGLLSRGFLRLPEGGVLLIEKVGQIVGRHDIAQAVTKAQRHRPVFCDTFKIKA